MQAQPEIVIDGENRECQEKERCQRDYAPERLGRFIEAVLPG